MPIGVSPDSVSAACRASSAPRAAVFLSVRRKSTSACSDETFDLIRWLNHADFSSCSTRLSAAAPEAPLEACPRRSVLLRHHRRHRRALA